MNKENPVEHFSNNEKPVLEIALDIYDSLVNNPQTTLESKIPEIISVINPLLPCLKDSKEKLPIEKIAGKNMSMVQKTTSRNYRIFPYEEVNMSIEIMKETAENLTNSGTHIGIVVRDEQRGTMTISLNSVWGAKTRLWMGFYDGKRGQDLTLFLNKSLLKKKATWKQREFRTTS